MYLNGTQTRLKIGDVAIFRSKDRVVQFLRKGHRLTDQFGDDKSIVSNEHDLLESECFQIAQIIADTHGFIVKNESDLCGRTDTFRFVFLRKDKKIKERKKRENTKGKLVIQVKVPKNNSSLSSR